MNKLNEITKAIARFGYRVIKGNTSFAIFMVSTIGIMLGICGIFGYVYGIIFALLVIVLMVGSARLANS